MQKIHSEIRRVDAGILAAVRQQVKLFRLPLFYCYTMSIMQHSWSGLCCLLGFITYFNILGYDLMYGWMLWSRKVFSLYVHVFLSTVSTMPLVMIRAFVTFQATYQSIYVTMVFIRLIINSGFCKATN